MPTPIDMALALFLGSLFFGVLWIVWEFIRDVTAHRWEVREPNHRVIVGILVCLVLSFTMLVVLGK